MNEPIAAYANGRCPDCKTVRLFHYRGAVVGAQYVPCEKHHIVPEGIKNLTVGDVVALDQGASS